MRSADGTAAIRRSARRSAASLGVTPSASAVRITASIAARIPAAFALARSKSKGASPLGYVAMARFDTLTYTWRDVAGTGAMAHVLIAAGAPVDGVPGDSETPLITAASYGDADVAAVLIAAGADVDATASADSGGVPGGSALLHAAVFGMTDVVDVLVAAGARVRSIEEAAAAGDIARWLTADTPLQDRLRALIMAADHQRIDVIDTLVAAGTPVDEADEVFERTHSASPPPTDDRPASARFWPTAPTRPSGTTTASHPSTTADAVGATPLIRAATTKSRPPSTARPTLKPTKTVERSGTSGGLPATSLDDQFQGVTVRVG